VQGEFPVYRRPVSAQIAHAAVNARFPTASRIFSVEPVDFSMEKRELALEKGNVSQGNPSSSAGNRKYTVVNRTNIVGKGPFTAENALFSLECDTFPAERDRISAV
jgi:hypothetical protein